MKFFVYFLATIASASVLVYSQDTEETDYEVEEITRAFWPPRRIQVTYELQYNDSCHVKDPPKPLKIKTSPGMSGQQIMEIAANYNDRYCFTAQFFSLSYHVIEIDDVHNAPQSQCHWLLYVGTEHGISFSPVGITHWIPFPDSKIVWRYTKSPY